MLLTKEQLNEKIEQMGAQISKDYEGKDLLIVCILKGSCIFMSELAKNITIPMEMDFMSVSSYGAHTVTSGIVNIKMDLDTDIAGKDVLVVEDILDTGVTLAKILELLASRKPASLKLAALLNKPDRRKLDIHLDYEGYKIPDEFVVGFGLDYNEKYRNLPFVGILSSKVYS